MKILIIKIAALGDVLVSSPFFQLIKNSYPECKIDHLVLKGFEKVTENNKYVNEIIIIKNLTLFNLIKLYYEIKKNNYDIAFIFHRNFLFQFICYMANINLIYGFKSKYNLFLKKFLVYKIDINRTLQEYNLIKLSGLKISRVTNLEYYINYNKIENFRILDVLPEKYIACGVGGGNIFSSADSRMWPCDYYIELISKVNFKFVLIGHGKIDKLRADEIESRSLGRVINLVGKTNYDEVANIIKNSTLYVGNDSSLLHLASAVGVPTLGLFGPTSPSAANPIGARQHFILAKYPCSPCYNPYDGKSSVMYCCANNRCMKSIVVDEVVRYINNLIK